MNKYDFISIGDSTHDTFLKLDEASIMADAHTKKRLLCLSWADKVPVTQVTQVPGVGNSANAAVALARLGFRTGIYTNVGDDVIGKSIIDVFLREGVEQNYIRTHKGMQSNYSAVLNYGAERTILVHHEPWKYDLPKGMNASWFYYSSLGPSHARLHKQFSDHIQRKGTHMAFQPGTYQLREGKTKLKPILQSTEVLLLNKEEAQIMLGQKSVKIKGSKSTRWFVKKLMVGLHKLGPKKVVVTDGPQGAYCFDGSDAYYVNIFPKDAIERTGAGDAFSSGFVGALAKGKELPEALLWGNANSTSVVQYIGAQKGLLTESGIKKMIKKYHAVQPVKI